MGSHTPNFDRMVGNPMCKQIPWDRNPAFLAAWKEGRTGYPWIDAIMTQLREWGWMHHLARHSVACFLTRGDLYISWEEGKEVFEELLLDAVGDVMAGGRGRGKGAPWGVWLSALRSNGAAAGVPATRCCLTVSLPAATHLFADPPAALPHPTPTNPPTRPPQDHFLNAANWQWLSASAFFSQYYRVYSPVTFGKKYDPEGKFIRRFLPQLAAFPAKYIYEPWTAPLDVQRK